MSLAAAGNSCIYLHVIQPNIEAYFLYFPTERKEHLDSTIDGGVIEISE